MVSVAVEGQGGQHGFSPPWPRVLLAGLGPARLGLPVPGGQQRRELSSILGAAQGVPQARWGRRVGAAQLATGKLPTRPQASLGAPPGTPLLRSIAQLAGFRAAWKSQFSSGTSGQDHPAALHSPGVLRCLLGSPPPRRGLPHPRFAGHPALPLMWCSAASRAGRTLRAGSGASAGHATPHRTLPGQPCRGCSGGKLRHGDGGGRCLGRGCFQPPQFHPPVLDRRFPGTARGSRSPMPRGIRRDARSGRARGWSVGPHPVPSLLHPARRSWRPGRTSCPPRPSAPSLAPCPAAGTQRGETLPCAGIRLRSGLGCASQEGLQQGGSSQLPEAPPGRNAWGDLLD